VARFSLQNSRDTIQRQAPPRERLSRTRSEPVHIQDSFLFGSLKEKTPVVVALLTDKILQGRIARFDRYTVVIDDGLHEFLLYKQSIACIARASVSADAP